jgi:hypothetical protein
MLGGVIPGEAAPVAGGTNKAKKVAETAAEIDDRCVWAPSEKTEKLPVTLLV